MIVSVSWLMRSNRKRAEAPRVVAGALPPPVLLMPPLLYAPSVAASKRARHLPHVCVLLLRTLTFEARL